MIRNNRSHCFYSPFKSFQETVHDVCEDKNVDYSQATNSQQVDTQNLSKLKNQQKKQKKSHCQIKFKIPSIFCSTIPQSVTLDQVDNRHVFISTSSGIEPPFSYSNYKKDKIYGLGRDIFPISLRSDLDTDNR